MLETTLRRSCRNISRLLFREKSTFIKRKYPMSPDDVADDATPEITYTKGDVRQMYVWGMAQHGGLGIQRQMKRRGPTKMPSFLFRPNRLAFAEKHKVSDIACGYGFTVIANKDPVHKLFGCGLNTDSQLGYQEQRSNAPMSVLLAPVPINLPVSPKSRVASVAAGRAHLLVLVVDGDSKDSGGKVYALGNNAFGQCGRPVIKGENYSGSRAIHCIKNLENTPIRTIACGQDHSLFVSTKGELFACGWGADGQTGQGHYANTSDPCRLGGDIQGENMVKVAAAADCNLALNDKGELFGWGNSEYGQLLNKAAISQEHTPRKLKMPSEVGKIIDVAAAGSFCAVLNSQGDIWVWGYGLLGFGPEVTYSFVPQKIPPPILGYNAMVPSDYRIKSITCGLYFMAALSNTGSLYTWGLNKEGCLGLGQKKDQPFPLRVSIGAQVLKVACGVDHMVALCKPFGT